MVGILKKIIGFLFLIPVYIYKYVISPYTPASCRHTPTCSEYFIEAVKIHGPFKGSWLGIKRISRCHPWGTHGYDPVPIIDIKKYKPKKRKKKKTNPQ
ncbi:MAG: membrane protein insertion efficiency factor YidD [Bacteroidota bacterium]|nr:membrane protein insertion efficiency factor YidD [Bacteroidota bacterium]